MTFTANVEVDTIDSAISALRDGHFIVVLDSPSREDEGDLVIAAQDVSSEKMAFMIRHSSGVVCVAMSHLRAAELSLQPMVKDNTDHRGTAFTASVDLNHPDISTGISSHDRASTCRALAWPKATVNDFSRPGHVFPLVARVGGVMERPGHTEAAVELCHRAGKSGIGVLAELVDHGTEVPGQTVRVGSGMMRRDACIAFSRQYDLKICTIADLEEYVSRPADGHRFANNDSADVELNPWEVSR